MRDIVPLLLAARAERELRAARVVAPSFEPTLPPHEPDYGRTGHPKHWCERCRIEAASVTRVAPLEGE